MRKINAVAKEESQTIPFLLYYCYGCLTAISVKSKVISAYIFTWDISSSETSREHETSIHGKMFRMFQIIIIMLNFYLIN